MDALTKPSETMPRAIGPAAAKRSYWQQNENWLLGTISIERSEENESSGRHKHDDKMSRVGGQAQNVGH